MIQGQISIFELMQEKTTSNKNCQDCASWINGACRRGDCMVETYPKCINKDKWRKRISKWELKEPTYQRWLKTPDKTFIFASQEERRKLLKFVGTFSGTEYGDVNHVCKQMPKNIYAWLNTNRDNYFVFNIRGQIEGKQHDICPYCGANLKKGEGDVILIKKHEKFWISHLYWDKPIHDHGELTEEERKFYKQEHFKGFGN